MRSHIRTPHRQLAGLLLAAAAVACGDVLGSSDAAGATSLISTRGDTSRRSDTTTKRDTSAGRDTTTKRDTTTGRDTTTKRDTTTGRDTTTKSDSSARTDTTARPDTGVIQFKGIVRGMDSTVTPPVILGPIAQVRIVLYTTRFVVVPNSRDSLRVEYDSVAGAESGTDGSFLFADLRSGAYHLKATPPSGAGYHPVSVGIYTPTPRRPASGPITLHLLKK
jgi:hypothetical protein